MSNSRAMIAMSGGVDSSVAAYLIQHAGYECVGATMQLCDSPLLGQAYSDTSADDARNVAAQLGMPFLVFDQTADFRDMVVEPFICCYEGGGTPNPCIYCNRHLKFGILLQKALEAGCDCIATGHYAKITRDQSTGRYLLYRAADKSKDQTYFLSFLTQEQLALTRFPLGSLTKDEVRIIAETQGFHNAKKRDSQDICFIPDGDYFAFMQRYTGKVYEPGDFLDLCGKVVGQHKNAAAYTLGQRKGLGLAMGAPVYVCSKDMAKNTVTVGADEDLYKKTLRANDWNWISFSDLTEPIRVTAKVRYRHVEQPATVYPEENGFARVEFDEPQRAITTGQAVVLYDGDLVIGGGIITDVL